MAIKALSQEPCEDAVRRTDMLDAVGHGTTYTTEHLQKIINGLPSVNPVPCEDAVSRQAVSEWYCNMTCDKDYCTEPCLEHKQIMMLPSVQPSRKGWEEMTVPCENCGHDMTFKIAVCGEPSNLPCEDAVSRQAVLDIIDAEAWAFCDYLIKEGRNAEQQPVSHFSDNLRERIRYKDELPSVQPKAKTGRCADCKYYHVKWDGTETHYFEDYWCEWVEPNEDDYCSLFEQKGGAE